MAGLAFGDLFSVRRCAGPCCRLYYIDRHSSCAGSIESTTIPYIIHLNSNFSAFVFAITASAAFNRFYYSVLCPIEACDTIDKT